MTPNLSDQTSVHMSDGAAQTMPVILLYFIVQIYYVFQLTMI